MNRKKPFAFVDEAPVIVGTGLIALDVVINSEEHHFTRLWAGGTCGNVLTILSYLGWQGFPISRLISDQAYKLVRKDLLQWGVRLDFARSSPGAETPIIVHKIYQGLYGEPIHRFSRTCPKCRSKLPGYKAVLAPAAKKIAAKLEKPKVFFLDRVSRGALILAKACAEKGAVVVFEPTVVREPRHIREALELAHILKYSHDRKRKLSEVRTTARPLLEIETLGHKGLRYRSRVESARTNGWERLDAYEVSKLKDTAGAGDWCTAGIVHRLGQKGLQGLRRVSEKQLCDALRFGQALAAWNCSFEGARGGMYSVDRKTFHLEVKRIMAGQEPKAYASEIPGKVIKDALDLICPMCVNKQKGSSLPGRLKKPSAKLR